jgi:hypothetical protein
MSKELLFLIATSLFATSAIAQRGEEGAMRQDQVGPRTVVGCLQKIGNEYVIAGGGPGPKQYRVTGGDTSPLAKLLGHTVRVTGEVGESDPAVQATTPPNPGSTTGVTYNTINAEKVQDVTSNCSESGTEKPR